VTFDERGVSDFGRLQRYVKEGQPGDLTYIVFDLLFQDGEDLRGLPLTERKRRLHWLLGRGGAAVPFVGDQPDPVDTGKLDGPGGAAHGVHALTLPRRLKQSG